MEDKLQFECKFFSDDGEVRFVKSYDATESPNNKVISLASLSSLVTIDFEDNSDAGFMLKCGDCVLDADDDVVNVVSTAVKFGKRTVSIDVLGSTNDWELVDEWERRSQASNASKEKDLEAGVEDAASKDDDEDEKLEKDENDEKLEKDENDEQVEKVEDRKVEDDDGDEEVNDMDEKKVKLYPEAEEYVNEAEDNKFADALDTDNASAVHSSASSSLDNGKTESESESTSKLGMALLDRQEKQKEEGQMIMEKQQKTMDEQSQVFECSVPEIGSSRDVSEVDDNTDHEHKSMATFGAFNDGVSDWTQPSFISKDSSAPQAQPKSVPSANSHFDVISSTGSNAEECPQPDFLSACLKDVENLLGNNDEPEMKAKFDTILATLSAVITEVLASSGVKTSNPDSVSDSGDDEDLNNSQTEARGILSQLLQVSQDREVVSAIQRFIASGAVTDLVVDLARNEAYTPPKIKDIVTNHLGDLLPEIGRVFRLTPQVLVLVPQLLVWLVALMEAGDGAESRTDSSNTSASTDIEHVVHENVICDGCDSSEERRMEATQNGTISGQYICGVRYKSAIVTNYDLCETCEASGEFEDSHAPFLKIRKPEKAPVEIVCLLKGEGRARQAQNGANEGVTADASDREGASAGGQDAEVPAGNSESVLVCPKEGHILSKFAVPNRLFACDVCDGRPKVGSIMYGCRACDWDMCHRCASHNHSGINASDEFCEYQERRPAFRCRGPLRRNPLPNVINYEHPSSRPRSKFVADVNVPDGCVVQAGAKFTKIWRVKNTSEHNLAWPNQCRIVCVGGDLMGSNPTGVLVPPVPAGEIADICVNLTAPSTPGRCVSYWRLITPSTSANPGGVRFGQRLWVDIAVAPPEASKDAQVPTEQPQEEPSAPPTTATENSNEPNQDQLFQKWSKELQQLAEMDFLDWEKNIELLELDEGDVTKVVERLVLD